MGSGPTLYSDIGKRVKDHLNKDYYFDQKFVLSNPGSTHVGLTATGVKRDHFFIGDISTQYKSRNTIMDVKVDTYSNLCTKVTINEASPRTEVVLSFDFPDNKSDKLDVLNLDQQWIPASPLLNLSPTIGSKDLALASWW